jgi:hypothetical protein
MVVLPSDFVATRYPGYFWNVVEKKLYSIKVTGELKLIKFNRGGSFGHVTIQPGYPVSHKGVRRKYTIDYLESLKAVPKTTHEVIGVCIC